METASKKAKYFKITDNAGNEFLCPLGALKKISDATEDELLNCVEEDVVGRYAGNIEVAEQLFFNEITLPQIMGSI